MTDTNANIDTLVKHIEDRGYAPASLDELEELWQESDQVKVPELMFHIFYIDYENEYINLTRQQIVDVYVDILMENLIDKEYMLKYTKEDLESCILNWSEQETGYYYKLYQTEDCQLVPITISEFGVSEITETIYDKLNSSVKP